jgi:hypothetical protein
VIKLYGCLNAHSLNSQNVIPHTMPIKIGAKTSIKKYINDGTKIAENVLMSSSESGTAIQDIIDWVAH